MIILGDEHLSPKIVRAVREIVLRKGWKFENVIGSEYCGRADEDWIEAFAQDGGNAIISADRAMLNRLTLLEKISVNGITGIYLPVEWASSKRHHQAAHILFWWPQIEFKISTCMPGEAWIVPKGFASTSELRKHQNPKRKF